MPNHTKKQRAAAKPRNEWKEAYMRSVNSVIKYHNQIVDDLKNGNLVYNDAEFHLRHVCSMLRTQIYHEQEKHIPKGLKWNDIQDATIGNVIVQSRKIKTETLLALMKRNPRI